MDIALPTQTVMLHIVESQGFEVAPCLFPTENVLCDDEPEFNSHPLPLSVSGSRTLSGDVILESWAAVLRYYVGNDMICFGRIDDTIDDTTNEDTARYAVHHGAILGTAALSALHASKSGEVTGHGSAFPNEQSPSSWIRSNAFFNTLVWNNPSTSSTAEQLKGTHVCFNQFIWL